MPHMAAPGVLAAAEAAVAAQAAGWVARAVRASSEAWVGAVETGGLAEMAAVTVPLVPDCLQAMFSAATAPLVKMVVQVLIPALAVVVVPEVMARFSTVVP